MKETTSETSKLYGIAGLSRDEHGHLLFLNFPLEHMVGYPLNLAAKLLGMDRSTLWREKVRGNIKVAPSGLISKVELERYAGVPITEKAKQQESGNGSY